MSWIWLGCGLVLAAAGEGSTVYHYRDAHGVDHYVNHAEQVPSGARSDPLKLTEDLNPQLAREMAENAHRAAEEAKAKAAEEAASRAAEEVAKGLSPEPRRGPVAQPPAETRLVLIWAIAFTVVFIVLWSTRGLLLRRSVPLAVAFQPVRWGAGIVALLSWIFLTVLARSWIADHVPPLQAISRARANVDKINRQQREAEQQLDQALKRP